MREIFVIFIAILVQVTDCVTIGYEDRLEIVQKIVKNDTKIEKNCFEDFVEIHRRNSTLRSVLSSWSNLQTDHKYGNSHDFGNFGGCKAVSQDLTSIQYCIVQYFNEFAPPTPVPPPMTHYQINITALDVSFLGAVCLPSSCGPNDVKEIAKMAVERHNLSVGQKILCKPRLNEKSKKLFGRFDASCFDFLNLNRIFLFGALILLAVAFTFFNIKTLKMTTLVDNLLTPKPSSTSYMHGIKAINSFSVILIHTLVMRFMFPFIDGRQLNVLLPHGSKQMVIVPITLAIANIDSYFMIGGILTARTLAKGFGELSKLRWMTKFFIRRLMRLVPVAVLIMALIVTSESENFAPYSFTLEKDNAKEFWWAAFIQDWISPLNSFAQYMWYLSVLIKLSLAAPFVFLAVRNELFGKYAAAVVILVAIACRYIYSFIIMDSMGTIYKHGVDLNKDLVFYHHYIRTPYRFLPFFGGLVLEEHLNRKQLDVKLRILKLMLHISVIWYFIFMILSTNYAKPDNFSQFLPPLDVILCLILLLVFFVLHFSDGTLRNFLSHRFWSPISKMSLSIYLMSGYIQFGIHKRLQQPLEIEGVLDWFSSYLYDILQVSVPVLLTYLFVEEPFSKIGELIAKKL